MTGSDGQSSISRIRFGSEMTFSGFGVQPFVQPESTICDKSFANSRLRTTANGFLIRRSEVRILPGVIDCGVRDRE